MNTFRNDSNQPIIEQIKHLEELLKNSEEDFWLGLQLSELYLAIEQYAEAKSVIFKILNQAEAKDDNDAIAACWKNLGIIGLLEKKYDEAKKWLSSALRIYESLQEPSTLGQICYHLALAHWADGESQQAVELLERSAKLLPHWPLVYDALAKVYGEGGKGKAYYHYAQGLSFELEQDYSNAIGEFQEAIRLGFENSEVYRRFGICLSEEEQYEKAVPALKKSIELDSTNAYSHADLAFIYQKLGMEHMASREYQRAVNLAPQVLKFYLNLVETYLQLDQVDVSKIWVEKALVVDDTDALVYWYHGRIYLRQGRLLDCQIAWQSGLKLAPEGEIRDVIENDLNDLRDRIAPSTIDQRSTAIEAWSKLPSKRGDLKTDTLIKSLKEISRLDPYYIDPQLELAQVYFDAGKSNDAKKLFEKILKQQPDNQDAGLGLGLALIELGESEEAESILRKIHTQAPQTEAGKIARWHLTLLDVRKRFGDLPALKFEEATSLYKRRDRDLQRIIDLMTEAVAIAPGIGLFHFELGWMYLLSERLNSAAHQFKLAIDAEPGEGRFYGGLGLVLIKQDKVKEAMPILLKAVDLDPNDSESHNALGICYIALEEVSLAENEFRKVTELDPYRQEGWNNLRDLLLKQKKIGQLNVELKRLLECAPNADFAEEAEQLLGEILETTDVLLVHQDGSVMIPEEATVGLSEPVARLCQQGRNLELAGFIDPAIEKYQEAIAEDFSAFDPHFLLANAYARIHQHKEAIKEYSFAVSMEASDSLIADAYFNMGNSCRDIDDFGQAIVAYRKAITTYSDILDARENIGICLAAQEKYEEAIQMLREELNLRFKISNSFTSHIHLQLGQILSIIEKDLEALFEFRKGMIGGPELGLNHYLVGKILASRSLWNLAQAEFEKALDLEPDNGSARAAVRAIRFVEYEYPWLSMKDDPQDQHSLNWRSSQIQNSYPPISQKIQLVHLGNGKYEKQRI